MRITNTMCFEFLLDMMNEPTVLEALNLNEESEMVMASKAMCEKQIESIAKKNAREQKYQMKKPRKCDTLIEDVYNAVTEEWSDVAAILERVTEPDCTAQKVISRLTKLVKENKVEKHKIAADSKVKTVYRRNAE